MTDRPAETPPPKTIADVLDHLAENLPAFHELRDVHREESAEAVAFVDKCREVSEGMGLETPERHAVYVTLGKLSLRNKVPEIAHLLFHKAFTEAYDDRENDPTGAAFLEAAIGLGHAREALSAEGQTEGWETRPIKNALASVRERAEHTPFDIEDYHEVLRVLAQLEYPPNERWYLVSEQADKLMDDILFQMTIKADQALREARLQIDIDSDLLRLYTRQRMQATHLSGGGVTSQTRQERLRDHAIVAARAARENSL